MSKVLFKRLEQFRKNQRLSVVGLCKKLNIHTINYYRWKNTQNISIAYRKIITDFLEQKRTSQFSSGACDIAVIGMGCHYPGASNIKELWENILARRVQFRRLLDQRLPLSEYFDADPKASEKTYLTKAAFLENFVFDWNRLRIPKKTVESTDIAHWLALEIALKTFEDAGYKLDEIPQVSTGVIVGNTLTGEQTRSQSLRLRWPFVQKVFNTTAVHLGMDLQERNRLTSHMEQVYKSPFFPITEDSLAGGLANTIAGRICNYLNLKGGGYIVDGACSSSLLAVTTACDALKMGNIDLILAGGVDISLDPFELVGFAKAGALARDKMSVYDQSANGFLPGEGCGFVLLKRLNDALRDKNYIYATIKGWGISSDGKGGIMEPSSGGQSLAIARAYKNLNYKISDVDFVEGHGTGTTKGDRVELEGIEMAIQQSLANKGDNMRTCGITSFKSIVGHTKAAAGVGGLIKAVLAVNQRILPPTASCQTPNDVFKEKVKHLYPLIQGKILEKDYIARAGISSAGFGGINCHVAVESNGAAKQDIRSKVDERALFSSQQQTEVFVFTSRTIIHLKKMIERFKKDLRNVSIAEMADLVAFLNKKVKRPLPIKAAIITDSPEHLYDALILLEEQINDNMLKMGEVFHIKANDVHTRIMISQGVIQCRVGFLYPGQGSQRLNMTRMLNQRFGWARDILDLSQRSLYNYLYKFVDKVLNQEETEEFEKQLADTQITQPAIVASSLMWTEFLSKLGVEPIGVAGHSLGELAAFYKAGASDKETMMKFADFRGALMACGHHQAGMVSLACSRQKANEIMSKMAGSVVIANMNSPSQTVVSGGKKEIDKVIELCQQEGIVTRRLNVSNAFHSPFMENASQKIKSSKILPEVKKINVNLYLSDEIKKAGSKINLREYFAKQVLSPVNFIQIIEAISQDCDFLIEVGPGRVLTDLTKAILKGQGPVCLPIESTAQNCRDLNVLLAELFVRNVDVKWEELYKNRLIRVFVPSSKKKFIENQCELPLRIGSEILKTESVSVSSGSEIVVEKEEVIPGGLPPSAKGKDEISDLLIELVHQMTGFVKQTITLNLRLLDDLNLDSIKAAEIIGQAARKLGLAGVIDPSKLSNNTLAEVRDKLEGLVVLSQAGLSEESVSSIVKRYQDRPWVRNFITEAKPEEILTKNVNQLKDIEDLVLLSQDDEPLSKEIIKELKTTKIKIQHVDYDGKVSKNSKADCLMVILPRFVDSAVLDEHIFKDIIKKSRKIVDLVYANQMHKKFFVVLIQFDGGVASSCGRALASTLFLERPDLRVRIINFDPKALEKEMAPRVLDEIQTYERFNAVEYDDKLKRKVIYYENSQPLDYKKRRIPWSPKDVVLVTGGARGITAQCALEFARFSGAHMILMGRSSDPVDLNDENNEIVATIKRFEKAHLKVNYYQCDVTDEKNVASVIKKVQEAHGKITGFIHGAGLNTLRRLGQGSVNEIFEESLPKVMGAVNVCKALEGSDLKLIVGITSIIGVTGMEGSGWYGLANEVLNLYLSSLRANSLPLVGRVREGALEVVTIAYSIWDELGMGARLGSIDKLAEKGIGAISVEEGVKRFRQLVESDPGVQQVIVAARLTGLDTWRPPRIKSGQFRFIDEIKYFLPHVELITQTHLNVKDDPYLLDHNWKGSLLFPFVFGFEAMAQAVAYVLGVEGFESITAKNINLERPISVPEETGTKIEIHALVLEQEKNDGVKRVKVEIYSYESAFQEPHFSAEFEIEGVIARSKATKQSSHPERSEESFPEPQQTLDINPQTDLYGPILFQGKMFQCIEKIHELYYDEKTKKGECVLTTTANRSAEEFLRNNKSFNNRFLIGDPFLIDSMLQSMQLIIPQDLCLPRSIEEISLIQLEGEKRKNYIGQSKIKKIDADHYRGDAWFRDRFSLKLKNCHLKVLDTIMDNPSVNDLVNPAKRDQKIIEDKLLEFSKELNFTPPVIKCLYDGRLKNASKKLRHQIELPLIKQAVEDVLIRNKRLLEDFQIKWLKSGKPIVEGEDGKGIVISISHTGSFLIVIAGYGEQGCDVEDLQLKDKKDWVEILGDEKLRFIEKMQLNNKEYNENHTVLWSIIEAAKKFMQREKIDLVSVIKGNSYFISSIKDAPDNFCLIAFVEKLTKGNIKVFSFAVCANKISKSISSPIVDSNFVSSKLGYDDSVHLVQLDFSGPQNQLVYKKKFPVTFKSNQNLSRSVYFSNYAVWMGEIREYGLYPIMQKLAELTATGGWGIATNYFKIKILGELWGRDTVEVRLWMVKSFGIKDSTFDWMFDWRKALPGGGYERVATSELRTTWIKIIGHGEAQIEEMPNFIKDFMDSMRPQINAPTILEEFPETLKDISIGDVIKENNILNKRDTFLHEESFKTSLEDSNLVGNIYFANYAKWLGKTRDLYFQLIVPDYYRGIGEKGEFLALDCDIDHLQEAMPFDTVLVRMYLKAMYKNGLDLFFEFYKIAEGEKEIKLAFGRQKIVWVKRRGIVPISLAIPERIFNLLV